MKRSAIFFLFLFICLSAAGPSFGQSSCEFNIVGEWKAVTTGGADTVLYRFAPDGKVTVLTMSGSDQPREVARATYKLDDPVAPSSIELTTRVKNRVFRYGKSSIKITEYADASMSCVIPGFKVTRWVKVDPNRYFIVLAARQGEFYDTSGSAFPILIKMVGRESQVDAAGTYSNHGQAAFGTVPPEAYKDLMREPRTDSEVMLRLEINAAQYERGLKIVRTWERRAREGALLYPHGSPLNNVLLVKAVTETLNQCSEEIKLYKLDYIHPRDWISDQYAPQFLPFAYFKELRRLNEDRHVRDSVFPLASLSSGLPAGQ